MLAEEYDPKTGHHLGNTPQAFSHAAVVTTAVRLSHTTGQLEQPATAAAVA
jgi:GH15 family glucan-1,4-alpha-glucosidase